MADEPKSQVSNRRQPAAVLFPPLFYSLLLEPTGCSVSIYVPPAEASPASLTSLQESLFPASLELSPRSKNPCICLETLPEDLQSRAIIVRPRIMFESRL